MLPRVAFGPQFCRPARNEFAPILSLFDDTFNELARTSRQSRRSFAPLFDVKEAKESYSLEGELPGVDPKDIQIEFTDEHTLTVKGRSERHTESGSPPPAAVEATSEKTAIQEGTTTPASDAGSVKSHQPTVEDEDVPATSAPESASQVAAPEPTKDSAKAPETPNQQYQHSERYFGSFERSFSFRSRVDQEAVKASLKNGILSIVVPKAKVPESRRIQIE